MPTFHNQTKNPLSWDMSGKRYQCESWGPVDIPDQLVPIAKGYGLPLGPVPVAPEHRARQKLADEHAAADADAFRALRSEADLAQADARMARVAVEDAQAELQKVRTQLRELTDQHKALKRDYAEAIADKKAAEDLISETARQATASEERAMKAEARLNDALSGAKKSPATKK